MARVPVRGAESPGGGLPAGDRHALPGIPGEQALPDRQVLVQGSQALPDRGDRRGGVGLPPRADRVTAGKRAGDEPRSFLVLAVGQGFRDQVVLLGPASRPARRPGGGRCRAATT